MPNAENAVADDPVDRIGYVAARVALAAIFLFTGFNKLVDIEGAAADIVEVGLPFPALLAVIAGLVELACGVLLALGKRTLLAGLGLMLFLLTVTLLMENPLRAGADVGVLIDFLKNLAIVGGLLMVVLREYQVRMRGA
ncbi:MAG: DoxX family protein [Gammaproteobacteria bacterium]|nr:DoxX family protein [Gammaproteobacteria bacterium]